jgi:AcrR family transcriptional regulator
LARQLPDEGRKPNRGDVAALRKAQVVEAAVAVIAEQGIQGLSLSAIEEKAGMARGHLTYYFPAKEDILLAVFDHLLGLMYQRLGTLRGGPPCEDEPGAWPWVRYLLAVTLLEPPASPEFTCLHYTFLSQIGHRDDVRRRLAALYEEWRGHMTRGLAADLEASPAPRAADPRLLASLVQALLHGLSMQLAADPAAFDREAMFRLCLDLLGGYLGSGDPCPPRNGQAPPTKNTTNRASPHRGQS